MAAQKGDRLALARGLILLPTNRAVQAVRDGFVRRAEPGLLLPRLAAIGDLDIDDSIGAALDPIEADVPPAIDPLRRQAMLARLIQQEIGGGAAEAMRLARELGRTRDQLLIARVSPAKLKDIGGDLAEHWQVSLRRLRAMLDIWPSLLAEKGHIDLAERRNRLLDRIAAVWAEAPPSGFVIAAGIDSAAPAIGNLLRTISRMPHGQVIFSGLDLESSDEEWARIAGSDDGRGLESHPQFHLQKLLTLMGLGRGEVKLWPEPRNLPRTSRTKLASLAFAPAEMTAAWHELAPDRREVKSVSGLELDTPAEEAQAIAIALREAIGTPGRTAALVTPDRDLATRVSALLRRWSIRADDSAGVSLSATKQGSLILALATALAEDFAPVPLMALLKHPLVMSEDAEARLDWLEGARALDKALRGPRPAPGLSGISEHVAAQACASWWAEASVLLAPMSAASDLATLLDRMAEVATALCGDRVWAGPEGRCLSDQIAALREGLREQPLDGAADALPQILRDRFDAVAVRPPAGGHPRLFIWGLIEARLQRADFVVLGGLNEGVWPGLPAPDPWLAPQIRRELKLPALEARIGLAAHDLASALGAPELLLTRAKRDASAPTTASRFWLRLNTLIPKGLPRPATPYDLLARALDTLEGKPNRAARPAPSPPKGERPRSLSVTEVDRLAADPFAFYARSMLGLARMEPLDAAAEAAWRGSIVHDLLDLWAKEDGYAPGGLVARMRGALHSPAVHPLTRTLALPRLIEAAQWIEGEVAANRQGGRTPLLSEESGQIDIDGIALRGRIDRIDGIGENGLAIVDYKTGAAPSRKQVEAGYALQLALLGAIADQGGFAAAAGKSSVFEYWSLARDATTREFGKIENPCGPKGIAPEDFVDHGVRKFREAAARWLTGDEPFIAKRAPDYTFDEYDHLMRLEEWDGRDG